MADLPQVVSNPLRTGVQIGSAGLIVEFIDAFLYNMDDRQYAALIAVLGLVFSIIQNLYEQRKGVYFLKPKQLTENESSSSPEA